MGQEDYFKKQLDQIGQVLGKILTGLVGLNNQTQANEFENANQILKKESGLDLHEIINLPPENFISSLKNEKQFSNKHLSQLADILFLFAANKHGEEKKVFYGKCLLLFEHLQNTGTVYSLDRQWKIERIRSKLASTGTRQSES